MEWQAWAGGATAAGACEAEERRRPQEKRERDRV
jgi:hypothetical protein